MGKETREGEYKEEGKNLHTTRNMSQQVPSENYREYLTALHTCHLLSTDANSD